MGLQFIVPEEDIGEVGACLGPDASRFELFSVPGLGVGVSIPTHLLDELGEEEVLALVQPLARFDLYEGAWVRWRQG
jgi:hypothetical protein